MNANHAVKQFGIPRQAAAVRVSDLPPCGDSGDESFAFPHAGIAHSSSHLFSPLYSK